MTPPRVMRFNINTKVGTYDYVLASEHDALVTYWQDRAREMAKIVTWLIMPENHMHYETDEPCSFCEKHQQAHAILDTEG